jgi:hypothetical protein
MDIKPHGYRMGAHEIWFGDHEMPEELADPSSKAALDFVASARRIIEPWLSAVFQSEHLNLLLGSGFTTSIANLAGAQTTGMSPIKLGSAYDTEIDAHSIATETRLGRGSPNIEDQFRSALALLEGLSILGNSASENARALKDALDRHLLTFLRAVLTSERGIATGEDPKRWANAVAHLQSFLLSFASRAASRERLHVFTTNYDRLIEYGCDLAGLRSIDRFVGSLNPVFRSSRVEVDVHYSPPGIRGEPRFLEGVLRLTKLHGSIDWHFDSQQRAIVRRGIPFGAGDNHSDLPTACADTVMIYPNPAKDIETTEYPYAELFRDYASALCRPNSAVVTYGYGFGDDHVNRVITDMLTIPSTHLVIIAYALEERLRAFLQRVGRPAQISLLLGPHFANAEHLVAQYLPKPALDFITGRMAELVKRRGEDGYERSPRGGDGGAGPEIAAGKVPHDVDPF